MTKMNPASRAKGDDEIYTPEWCAKDMVRYFGPTGKILEPCKGTGVFTDLYEHLDTENDIKTKTPGLDIFF